MYTLFVDMNFQAQHQLTFDDGTQEPLHEHDWKVCVAVCSELLNEDELVIDFEEVKCLAGNVLQGFRGQRLESLGIFEGRNASAENVAKIIYDGLAPKLPQGVTLEYIEVTEAQGCRARYSRPR